MPAKVAAKVPKSLAAMGTFFVSLWPKELGFPPTKKPIPLHDWVIRPIVSHATECRIYGLDYDRKFLKSVSPVVEKSGGSWQLRLDREVIKGYEHLWNDYCKTSGIAAVTVLTDEQLGEIFSHTSRPGLWSTRNMLSEGSSKAAVDFCFKAAASSENVALLFPGSNGIEWMDVFVHPDRLTSVYLTARCNGKFGATS